MSRIKLGFYSGTVATFVAGSILLMNNALHGVPAIHVASTLARLLGESDHIMVGVLGILVIGIFVFGGLFAALAPRLPIGTYLGKSLIFAAVTWLFTMVVVMPLDGSGFFGLKVGPILPEAMLALNLAYWIVLGLSYRWLAVPAGDAKASPDTAMGLDAKEGR